MGVMERISPRREYHQEYLKNNRDVKVAYHRAWRIKNPGKTREYWLKRYGITEHEYTYLLQKQNGHCALCDKTPEQEPRKVLSIDHCHGTGEIRGLLCMRHNNGIGMLGDNEAGLVRALEYVSKQWQA